MPLTMVNAGENVRVKMIRGKDETRRFLETLGFTEDTEVAVVAELGGNMIINVKGTRVAVSKTMAARIMTCC
ncbi:MAG TPA: ferrous iron transport protein A [Firmicutes bacterium]|nr:ferrous iron transport protein A [Bacillota bacterium]